MEEVDLYLSFIYTEAQIIEMIPQWNRQYTNVILSVDLTGNGITDIGAMALANYKNHFGYLTLNNNNITSTGMIALFNSVNPIRGISLKKNMITSRGLDQIKYPIYSLNLSFNLIGDDGAGILSKCIYKIYKLNLISTQIRDAGAISLANSVHTNRSLLLALNKITDIGAKVLARSSNPTHELDLHYNEAIGDPGATAFFHNFHLISLSLHMTDHTRRKMTIHIQNNKRRQSLKILAGQKVPILAMELDTIPYAIREIITEAQSYY